jgi:hypothetical protein
MKMGFCGRARENLAFLLGKKEDDLEEIIDKVRKEGFLGFAAYDTYDFLLLQMIQLKIIKKEEKEKTRREFILILRSSKNFYNPIKIEFSFLLSSFLKPP